MRLLHVAQPTTAGVPHVVLALVHDQVARGWDVTVACPPQGQLAPAATALGAAWLPWPASRDPGRSTAAEVARLRRVVRAARPELVHLHSAKAGLAGRLALRGSLPTVFAPHSWSWEAVEGPVRHAAVTWERAAARWTDLLVCVSRAELDAGTRARVRCRRAEVVANGVDLQRWAPADEAARRRARQELGVPDVPLAVCVGRLARQKGQDLLLDAWPGVRTRMPDALLVLVGDGPKAAALAAGGVSGVRLVGASTAVETWLAAADVVVVPSRWEGMALVPLEAMARARSVVAFDVAGIQESVPPGAGAVVPIGDVGALATAVADRLTGDVDADAEGRRGRAHVEQAHDVRRSADGLADAYARMLTARRAR